MWRQRRFSLSHRRAPASPVNRSGSAATSKRCEGPRKQIGAQRKHREIYTMARKRKVIITCAVTGAIHTPTMSPHLPITPDEIVREALAAAEAGASILHLHARDPKTGQPDPNPAALA